MNDTELEQLRCDVQTAIRGAGWYRAIREDGTEDSIIIMEAVKSYCRQPRALIRNLKPNTDQHHYDVWKHRLVATTAKNGIVVRLGGENYRQDMEQFVAAYRREPDPWDTDAARLEEMLDWLDKQNHVWGMSYAPQAKPSYFVWMHYPTPGIEAHAETRAIATMRAVVAAAKRGTP